MIRTLRLVSGSALGTLHGTAPAALTRGVPWHHCGCTSPAWWAGEASEHVVPDGDMVAPLGAVAVGLMGEGCTLCQALLVALR